MRKFKALQVPKKLQKDLPFKSKPKNEQKKKRKTYEDKRAVVMEKDEKKVSFVSLSSIRVFVLKMTVIFR